MTFDFNSFVTKFQKFLEDMNDQGINPLKILQLTSYLNISLDSTKSVNEFINNLQEIDEISFTYLDCGEVINLDIFTENEAFFEIDQARMDIEEDLRYRAPIEYKPYIDFEEMASNEIADLQDVYPKARHVSSYIELDNCDFCDLSDRIYLVEHE